jgi:uncharacterized repeat protein (TIGR02543 family)
MKNVRFLLLMIGVLLPFMQMEAQTRSAYEAQEIANGFFSSGNRAKLRAGGHSVGQLELRAVASELLSQKQVMSAEEAFYVFTPEEQEAPGFIIVSGDKRMKEVLGYSANERFDTDNLPPALLYWLEMYQRELEYVEGVDESALTQRISVRKKARQTKSEVVPMIASIWGQGTPFNDQTPSYNGEQTATGCVATAMAQVMNYYESPNRGTGSNTYTTKTLGLTVSYNYDNNTFDWDNMLDSYRNGYTATQGKAVANLMLACGVAVNMDYNVDGSGSNSLNQLKGLVNYMGYDQDMAIASRDDMQEDDWENLLMQDLEAGHPILYSGTTSDESGHAFILDGYQTENSGNTFHINWGWNGVGDGFYSLSALEPRYKGQSLGMGSFDYGNDALLGCMPDNGKTDRDSYWQGESLSVTPVTFSPSAGGKATVTAQMIFNRSNKAFAGTFLYYLIDAEGNEIHIGTKYIPSVDTFTGYSSSSATLTIPTGLKEGLYEIEMRSLSTDGTQEQKVYFGTGNPQIQISESGVDPDAPEYLANLMTTGLTLNSEATTGRNISVDVAQILNYGDLEFSGTLSLAIEDPKTEELTVFGETSSISSLTHFRYFTYPRTLTGEIPTNITDGKYKLYVVANQLGYSGWSKLTKYTLQGNYITNAGEECHLDIYIIDGVINLAPPTHPVTIIAEEGGTVVASLTEVPHFDSVEFTITPNEGYILNQALLNDVDVTAGIVSNKYVVETVTSDLTFKVTFKLKTFAVNTTSGEGGTITASASKAEYGGSVDIKVAPNEGYVIDKLLVNATDVTANIVDNVYTVTNIRSDIKAEASFKAANYSIVYKVDGEEYKKVACTYGSTIIPIDAPSKEGYTFSGWSGFPEDMIMPAHDVEVNGSFAVNVYLLTYLVDGEVYATDSVAYGTTIKLIEEPKKEGYTFSGWKGAPETMPAKDVTVTGTFLANSYKIYYKVDGQDYKTIAYAYGDTITAEPAPSKEGYTFSGWNGFPEDMIMPAKDLTVTGSFSINQYVITYMVDDTFYDSQTYNYGDTIVPLEEPVKEGCTFSGWKGLPNNLTMPAKDVTVSGRFKTNTYFVIYKVDGENYKSVSYEYGATIVAEPNPTRKGYTFSGWNGLPADMIMPAHNIEVNGSFAVNVYLLTYLVDGEVYATDSVAYGEAITLIEEPKKEGYTFSGWHGAPETMPDSDVTITGTFTVNSYLLTYMIDGEVYQSETYEYGATIVPIDAPTKEGYTFSGWTGLPEDLRMPAKDVTVTGTFTVGIRAITMDEDEAGTYYDLWGRVVKQVKRGGVYMYRGQKVMIK